MPQPASVLHCPHDDDGAASVLTQDRRALVGPAAEISRQAEPATPRMRPHKRLPATPWGQVHSSRDQSTPVLIVAPRSDTDLDNCRDAAKTARCRAGYSAQLGPSGGALQDRLRATGERLRTLCALCAAVADVQLSPLCEGKGAVRADSRWAYRPSRTLRAGRRAAPADPPTCPLLTPATPRQAPHRCSRRPSRARRGRSP